MKNTLVTSFAGLALAGTSAFGQLVSDNFNSYDTGSKTAAFGIYDTVSVAAGRDISIVTDADNLFGSGTGNQVLELADTAAASGTSTIRDVGIPTGNKAVVFSFDFVDKAGAGGDTVWTFRFGNSTLGVDNRWDVQFQGANLFAGTLGAGGSAISAYSAGTKYSVSFVVNNSSSAVNYSLGAGNTSVASSAIDVWVNGAKVSANATGVAKGSLLTVGSDITSYSWVFAAGAATDDRFFVDNLSITAPSAIPEPSAFAALAGLAGLGLAGSRRRARR